MRFPHRVTLTLALLAAALPIPATHANAATPAQAALAQIEERVYVESGVDSNGDGRLDRIAIDIARPSTGGPVPVVFEQSPYRNGLANAANHGVNVSALPQEGLFPLVPGAQPTAGISAARPVPDLPDWYDDYFVPKGYAVVLGHSLGTGASEGCPTSGDMQETLATTAVVDWLNGRARGFSASGAQVTASWSTGNVGMIGISYNGTLPNMAAATGVAGLKAIVPISAISSWYDYYRANGLVVAPGGYQGEDADVLARAVVDRTDCTSRINRIETDQDRVTGDYTQFWADRDYVGKANKVTAGVFVIHGQADWNVKGGTTRSGGTRCGPTTCRARSGCTTAATARPPAPTTRRRSSAGSSTSSRASTTACSPGPGPRCSSRTAPGGSTPTGPTPPPPRPCSNSTRPRPPRPAG
ncbi:CocE/NonD family hydrolase [Catellatospora coxensis]